MNPNQFKNNKFLIYTAASVLTHFAFFSLMFFSSQFESANKKNQSQIIEISFAEPDPIGKKEPKPTTIAETDSKTANNELSETAKFLSEKNNTVKKETKAKVGEKFLNTKNSSATAAKNIQEQQAEKPNKGKTANNKVDIFDNSFDAFSSMNKKEIKKQKAQEKAQLGGNSEQASTTNDNLENVESDLMTRLNTKEYRYFGYYNRIKTQLNHWWVPKVQQKFTKMLRQGRTIASEDNKVTKLVITLNDAGRLVKVQVMGESGIKDLDDAAIEAFRSAAPFPNPPKGMVDKDGLVKIRWDCVVES